MKPGQAFQNRDSYNKIAGQWSEIRDKSFLSLLVKEFASKIKTGGKVLDIGCGTGYPIAAYLSVQGFEVTGIDLSENLLQKALNRNLPNAEFHLCDFFDFKPMEKYDGIIAFDSFFHFDLEKQRTIYERVSGWMNPGACLLFTHGVREGEHKGKMFDEVFYYSSLNRVEVYQLLSDSGLEILWSQEKYVERDMDRDLVILAQKLS